MKYNIYITLLVQDLKERYLGSFFGILWAFLNPVLTILVMWFVFRYGFDRGDVDGYPYVVWFIAGFIPWFYFSESLMHTSSSIVQKAYLVKKTTFDIIFLPSIKVVSNLCIHIILVIFMLILFYIYDIEFSLYTLQLIYYIFALVIFLHGLAFIFSSLTVFIPDMKEVVSLLIRFGFWLTPIFWSLDLVPEKYKAILELNPVYYIIQGFRDTLLYKRWFWESDLTMYFWIVTSLLSILGFTLFKRLQRHFADVL